MKDVFVVEALRWGDREDHTYVVGVFDNLHDACEACVIEELWRGGKYECFINVSNEMNIELQEQKEELLSERDVEEFNLEVQKRVDQQMRLESMTSLHERMMKSADNV